jgi:putative transposase
MENICGSIGSMNFNVWSARKRIEKLKYMHRNPVVRELVSSPEDWKWSSYRFHLSGEEGPVRINEGWTEIRLPIR